MTLKDHEGCTPLHLACGSSLDSAMEMQTTIVVDTLTSHGAGVNAKVGNNIIYIKNSMIKINKLLTVQIK